MGILDKLQDAWKKVEDVAGNLVDATQTNLRHLDDNIHDLVSDAVSATKTNLSHLNDDLTDYLPYVQRALNAYLGYTTGDWVKVVGAIAGGQTQSNIQALENIQKTYNQIIEQGKDIPPPRGTEYQSDNTKTWVKPTVYDELGNVVDVPAYGELISDVGTYLDQYNTGLSGTGVNIATAVKVDTEAIAEVMDQQVYAINDLTNAVLDLNHDDLTQAAQGIGDDVFQGLNYLANDLTASVLTSGSMISDSLDQEVQDLANTITDTNNTLFDGLHNLDDAISAGINNLIGLAIKPIGLALGNLGQNIWEAFLSVFFEEGV